MYIQYIYNIYITNKSCLTIIFRNPNFIPISGQKKTVFSPCSQGCLVHPAWPASHHSPPSKCRGASSWSTERLLPNEKSANPPEVFLGVKNTLGYIDSIDYIDYIDFIDYVDYVDFIDYIDYIDLKKCVDYLEYIDFIDFLDYIDYLDYLDYIGYIDFIDCIDYIS